jgi:hypothetical protein
MLLAAAGKQNMVNQCMLALGNLQECGLRLCRSLQDKAGKMRQFAMCRTAVVLPERPVTRRCQTGDGRGSGCVQLRQWMCAAAAVDVCSHLQGV